MIILTVYMNGGGLLTRNKLKTADKQTAATRKYQVSLNKLT
jgi:hypothetical protein